MGLGPVHTVNLDSIVKLAVASADVLQETTDTSPQNATTFPPNTTNCTSHIRMGSGDLSEARRRQHRQSS
jgi:hypothetical protein